MSQLHKQVTTFVKFHDSNSHISGEMCDIQALQTERDKGRSIGMWGHQEQENTLQVKIQSKCNHVSAYNYILT